MKPIDRLFPPNRDETAKALLSGASRVKIDCANWGGKLHIEIELHASIEADAARRVLRDVLGQLEENAERDKEEEDDD